VRIDATLAKAQRHLEVQTLPPLESETRSADRIGFDKLWDLMCEKLGRQAQAGA
jgi:hypothetical protein